MAKPTIYIIDDNKEVCESLEWLIKSATDYLVTSYNHAKNFLNDYNVNLYGCLIIDILMPDMNGFELLHELKNCGNQMPIIILTGHGDIPMAVQAVQAGAKDFITKPFNSTILLQKIQAVISQYEITFQQQQALLARYSELTLREMEIVNYMIMGKLNKQIAAELNITLKTVEKHRFSIMHKLKVKTIAELIHNYAFLFINKAN